VNPPQLKESNTLRRCANSGGKRGYVLAGRLIRSRLRSLDALDAFAALEKLRQVSSFVGVDPP
jgi:hypothetical protein